MLPIPNSGSLTCFRSSPFPGSRQSESHWSRQWTLKGIFPKHHVTWRSRWLPGGAPSYNQGPGTSCLWFTGENEGGEHLFWRNQVEDMNRFCLGVCGVLVKALQVQNTFLKASSSGLFFENGTESSEMSRDRAFAKATECWGLQGKILIT